MATVTPAMTHVDGHSRVYHMRTSGVHGRLLVETWLCTFPPAFLVALGHPDMAAKLCVTTLFALLVYHLTMRQPLDFVALSFACLPMLTLLRGLFLYYSVIMVLGGGLAISMVLAPADTARLWRNVHWKVAALALGIYWWLSFVRTGMYSTNLRAFELALSFACTILLAYRRSYLGTALLGLAISTTAVAIGLLPYGDRLGQGEIGGVELGNPILLGLPALLTLLVAVTDSGKWILLQRRPALLLAVSVITGFWLILSISRGSWLAAAVSLTIVLIWNKGGKRALLMSLVLLFLGIAALLSTERGAHVASYFSRTIDSERSLANRTSFRSVQWEVFPFVFSESPVWGWGPGSGVEVAGQFTGRHLGWHSLYLQAGGETGLIGLGFLVWLFASLLSRGVSHLAISAEMLPLLGTVTYMVISLSVSGMDAISGIFLGLGSLAGHLAAESRIYQPRLAQLGTSR